MAIDVSKVKWDDAPAIDPSRVQWDDAPQKPSNINLGETRALYEVPLNLVSQGYAALGGGLNYLGTLAATGGDTDAAASVMEDTQRALTYQPRSQAGQMAVGGIQKAMGGVENVINRVGEKAAEQSGSPLVGALMKSATYAPLLFAGAKPAAAGVQGVADMTQAGVNAAGKAISVPINALRPSKIAERHILANAGRPEQLPAIVDALRGGKELDTHIPNAGPTSAQLLTDVPEGTGIQAIQKSVAEQGKKGIAADYSRRFAQQEQAIEAATSKLNAETAPAREAAMANIKAQGGVDAARLYAAADDLSRQPVAAGSPEIATRIIDVFHRLLRDNTDKNGKINPETLYQFRKTGLDQVMRKAAEQDPGSLKFAKTNIGTAIRNSIDDAMSAAGGDTWRSYLKTYSEGMKPISALRDSLDTMYDNFQRSQVAGTGAITSGQLRGPSLFSRETSAINYGLGALRKFIEPAVDRRVADFGLKPQTLADLLAQHEVRPTPRAPITDPSLLLPSRASFVQGATESLNAADKARAPWGDSRVAPPSVGRLPPPGREVGGADYAPQQPSLVEAMTQRGTSAALQHPARPNNPLESTVTRAAQRAKLNHLLQVLAYRNRLGQESELQQALFRQTQR